MAVRLRDSGGISDAPTLRRFELTADLIPEGEAQAKWLKWNSTLSQWDASDTTFTLHEGLGVWSGPIGSRGTAMYSRQSHRWEVMILKSSAIRIAVLDGVLNFNASAVASLYEGTPDVAVDTTDNVTVWCHVLTTGQSIPSGTKVDIAWDGDHWEVVSASC